MSIIEKLVEKQEKDGSKNVEYAGNDATAPERDTAEKHESLIQRANQSAESRSEPPEADESLLYAEARQSRTIDIDLPALKKAGYLTPDSVNIVLAEQYRRIKRPVLINAFEDKGTKLVNRNLVMVTSAVPKEGKTFTSINLALSIAREINQTVLFIDADITRRTSSRTLGLEHEPGLTDFLVSENTDLSDYLLKSTIPNLSILPAGNYHEKTSELWASNRMRALLPELSRRYHDRVVIFDAPPILQDSSAHILARLVGQVVFVIEAEKTYRHLTLEALQTIADAQYIGLVLNKSNMRLISEYGYYGHVNFPLPGRKPPGTGSV